MPVIRSDVSVGARRTETLVFAYRLSEILWRSLKCHMCRSKWPTMTSHQRRGGKIHITPLSALVQGEGRTSGVNNKHCELASYKLQSGTKNKTLECGKNTSQLYFSTVLQFLSATATQCYFLRLLCCISGGNAPLFDPLHLSATATGYVAHFAD